MPVADLPGAAIGWREDGDPSGRPVVFANSLGTDLRLWDAVVARLPSGLRVIRHDMRGHGGSSVPPPPYAMDDLVGDAEGLLDQLGVRGCAFVGLSIGGMVAQGLAARRPDLVGAAVLSNTAARMGTAALWAERIAAVREGGVGAIADAVIARWFGPDAPGGLVREWRERLAATSPEGYAGCCAAIAGADLREATAGLRLPTLGIAGERDLASTPEEVGATVALVPGARLETIPDAGHLPCVEAPDAYAAILARFLEETAAEGRR